MKKACVIFILAVTFLLSGCNVLPNPPVQTASPSVPPSAPASADEVSVGDYFPFKENAHLTYRGTGNEYAGFESYVDYINNGAIQLRTSNGGTESVNVYVVENGAVKKVFKQDETYYRYDFTGERTMNEILLMEPLAVGTSWTLDNGAARRITAVNAAVTVPYGTFTAIEVTTTDKDSTIKEYYAAGTGLVKRVFTSNEDPSSPVTSELERFEEGSPLNQNARFYYPDFNNNKVAYIEKTIEFYTGDNIVSKFEYEFKHVPAGSKLTPVMPEGATINSISYNRNTRVVTVDFSNKFITEMNAGSALEGMILNSVANTLGYYFATDKVAITINGGRYESGHFLFDTGKYLPMDLEGAIPFNNP